MPTPPLPPRRPPRNLFLFTSFADPSNYLLSFHIFPKNTQGVGSTSVPLLPLRPPLLIAHHSSLAAPSLAATQKPPATPYPSMLHAQLSSRRGRGTLG